MGVYQLFFILFIGYLTYVAQPGVLREMLVLGIPICLMLNGVAFVVLLALRASMQYFLLFLIAFIVSFPVLKKTVAFNTAREVDEPTFSVMSFNAAAFTPDRYKKPMGDTMVTHQVFNYFNSFGSPDILCIQEFFHSDVESRENTLDSLSKAGGYRYYYMNPDYSKQFNGILGVVTFSRFPAVASGKLNYNKSPINKGTWHDLIIYGDTIRVVNFHLNSMSIRWRKDGLDPIESVIDIWERLEKGARQREVEVAKVMAFLEQSPHPLVVCCDMNAVPYSDAYAEFSSILNNAFEDGGNGLGYSYRRFPSFIRIDNQFYDEKALEILSLETKTSLKASDHYPIEGVYTLK